MALKNCHIMILKFNYFLYIVLKTLNSLIKDGSVTFQDILMQSSSLCVPDSCSSWCMCSGCYSDLDVTTSSVASYTISGSSVLCVVTHHDHQLGYYIAIRLHSNIDLAVL